MSTICSLYNKKFRKVNNFANNNELYLTLYQVSHGLDEIMYGDKYGIESAVFVEVFRMLEQKVNAKTIREQLNMIYVKHSLLTAKKMIKVGDTISDIPEFALPSFRVAEKRIRKSKNKV